MAVADKKPILEGLIERAKQTVPRIQVRANDVLQRFRTPLTIAAVLGFLAGLAWSILSLEISPENLSAWPLVILFFLAAPLGIGLGALNLSLCAHVLGRSIRFREGFVITAYGTVADMLPLPGGAMVRGAALMRAGAELKQSAGMVIATAALTMGLSLAAGAVPILMAGYALGWLILAAGVIGLVGSSLWITKRSGLTECVQFVGLRGLQIAVGVVRVSLGFAAIGLFIAPTDAALFVLTGTVGTSISIVPSGIGISEGLGAALAGLVQIAPAAAFLVISINRIVNLLACGAIALSAMALTGRKPVSVGPSP